MAAEERGAAAAAAWAMAGAVGAGCSGGKSMCQSLHHKTCCVLHRIAFCCSRAGGAAERMATGQVVGPGRAAPLPAWGLQGRVHAQALRPRTWVWAAAAWATVWAAAAWIAGALVMAWEEAWTAASVAASATAWVAALGMAWAAAWAAEASGRAAG
jgi:hypothetical protein